MSAPRWARALLGRLAGRARRDEILGDLEEAHGANVRRRGRVFGALVTALETLDMAVALVRHRGLRVGLSWLDFKLGFRMLVRYPGLTALGGLAIAFAMFAGSATFEFLSQVAYPRLPFDGGNRLVVVQRWDPQEGDPVPRTLFDLGVWRSELTTVEHLGAFDPVIRNLIVPEGGAHPLSGVEIDAVAFRLTGVEPLLGRTLTDEDQRPDAPSVAVLGHGAWRTIFGGEPDVIGRVVRVGPEQVTVVGVMPEGFTFPIAHEFWMPLRANPLATAAGEGPGVRVFGRLAEGASLDDAQAEVERIGERLAAAFPATHESTRTFVRPYALAMLGLPASMSDGLVATLVMAYNIPLVLFLLLVSGNVALLMFARAAARESELVVRNALGAGRRRIVGQLFAEALVLALFGAALGLAAAGYGLRWAYHMIEAELWGGPLPFWFEPELSLRAVLYALGLTVLGAAVAGVLPALKATRGLGSKLREGSAGGGGMRFGGVWTVVIVLQIAVTVVAPALGFAVALEGKQIRDFDLGIPAHEFMTAQVAVEPTEAEIAEAEAGASQLAARRLATLDELEEKLLVDPQVAAVTFAELPPRAYAGWHQIEVDGPTKPPQDERGHRMGAVDVETDFFETLGIEPRAGRDFRSGDAESGTTAVIVNEAFVDYVLGGRNALGVTFRYLGSERNRTFDEPGPWHEIVGVVQDLGRMSGYSSAVIYHPMARGEVSVPYVLARVRGDAEGFTPRLREIAFDVDPTLRLREPVALDHIVDGELEFYRFWILTVAMVSGVAVVLSLGGIYAVMSFTVSRRTREIGVRVALGAPQRRVILSIFRRPLTQVALGLALGGFVTAILMGLAGANATPKGLAAFTLYVTAMAAVCMLACLVPARRALSVEPSEALRSE